jgi:hypothetical protein
MNWTPGKPAGNMSPVGYLFMSLIVEPSTSKKILHPAGARV